MIRARPDPAWLVAIAIATVMSAAALLTARPRIVGLFHDDGIYVATAQSIAVGTGYRITTLPGAPPQTKYPVLYPYLLSWIWRINPDFPDNVRALKSVNAASLFVLVILSCAFFRRYVTRSSPSVVAYLALVGTNSMLISFSDFTLSDGMFDALALAALLLHDDDADKGRLLRTVCGAAVTCMAFLTREAGAALVLAGLLATAFTRSRRELVVYAAVSGGLTLIWLAWRASAPVVTNPLVSYYTAYETPAIGFLLSNPRLTWQIVAGNMRYLLQALDLSLLLAAMPLLRWLIYPLMLLGCGVILRKRPVFLSLFVLIYLAAVLDHPFAPGRYLTPLVAIALACIVAGGLDVEERVSAWLGAAADRGLVRAGVHVPIALLVVLNLAWFGLYVRRSADNPIRGWYGQPFAYGWSGFEETFEWVRTHTKKDDVLATPYDPLYYLYTGRRGVRPWIHHPDTYFYPVGKVTPDLGDPLRIRLALDELAARYLVIDPLEGYAEKPAAPLLFERLLATYDRPRLVFVSHDSQHKVYDLRPMEGAPVQ